MCTASRQFVLRFSARAVCLGASTVAAILLFGCADLLGLGLVHAPNQSWNPQALPPTPIGVLKTLGVSRELRVDVGPPDASLAVWVVDPPQQATAHTGVPRGTILVLHGLFSRKELMLGVGKDLASAGFRAVLLDFRGQGASSGEWITFGAVETGDLSQALDALEADGTIVGPVGVYGTSFGGGVGIQLAGADSRVKAVVAIAPFESLEAVTAPLIRPAGLLGEVLFSGALLDAALDRAAEFGNFDVTNADALSAIAQTDARVMIAHGKLDTVVPYGQSVDLAAAAGDRAKLVLLDWADHSTIMIYQHGELMNETLAWFDEWLQ